MPITRSTILLADGQHSLLARAAAPANLQALRDGNFSLHHILPYRYPLFIGFLAQTYGTTYGGNTPNWPEGSTDRIAMQTAGILKVVSRFGSEQHGLPSKFAWMGPNLFQGPSGNYRTDDPGSEREPKKPISYGRNQWDALQQVGNKIDGLVASLGSNNQGYTVTTRNPITVGDFEDLLNLLSPIADVGHGNAHTFNADDWVVMSTSDARFLQQYLKPNAQMTVAIKNLFKALPSNRIINLRPTYLGAVNPTNPNPPLWRLRTTGEPVPADEIKGPRLQP